MRYDHPGIHGPALNTDHRREPGIDLLMRATAVDGKIESSYPLSLKQAGTTTVAELALGKARPELTITGTRTRIVVGED